MFAADLLVGVARTGVAVPLGLILAGLITLAAAAVLIPWPRQPAR